MTNDKQPDPMPTPDATDGLIQALPDTLASKIAAGEVVQRPANALKELVENALDAGASRVEVTLKKAGSELIQVADDGCGMGPADAAAAFGRHATSKIRRFEDLERLRTLGFRGEALASIASVAQVEMKTRRHGDEVATCIRVEGGEVVGVELTAAPEGTTISVRNLFYNVPARRAFLKSAATEFKHLVEAFQSLALSHPEVAFTPRPRRDRGVAPARRRRGGPPWRSGWTRSPAAAWTARPWPSRRRRATCRCAAWWPGPSGRVGRGASSTCSSTAATSRAASSTTPSRGAFGALLPDRHHPLYALFLDVDPRHVDVNVHPTKTEVKFDDDRGVYSFVKAVVKRSLAQDGLGFTFQPDAPRVASAEPVLQESPDLPLGDGAEHAPPPAPRPVPVASTVRLEAGSGAHAMPSFPPLPEGPETPPTPPAPSPVMPAAPVGPIQSRLGPAPDTADDLELDATPDRALWQLHGRWLLSPVRSGLLVVDQRAAHERILYEKALAAMEGGMAPSQQLLFPFTVDLGAGERALLAEILPDLRALGFDMEAPEGKPVLVRGRPRRRDAGPRARRARRPVAPVPPQQQPAAPWTPARTWPAAWPRAAPIRPGHPLGPVEARSLVDQLFACDDPFSDPSGRPTMTRLPSDEIERRFRSP